MTVMAREKWSDERLDDLNVRVEKGFDEVKDEIREVKSEIRETKGELKGEVRELRKEMNTRFVAVEARFNSVEARLDGLNRSLVLGFVSMTASIVGALLVTQL